MPHWAWGSLGAIAIALALEELRMYWLRREAAKREEIFQVVTENAADMIALLDVKGRRLYNSPAYKRVLGYSPAELSETSSFEQIHPEDRMRVLEAAR
jgi:PAS domain-containing protein